ncbi:MAG: class I SAM-dependent methyltransferase [Syntrophomonadaceae bacterium]|jgi:16S rRNA (guanine1516-N2)-methyltransferase|nr:class I SAM-dependent methyltransferase [Syntrophomonadaceae bacterium]
MRILATTTLSQPEPDAAFREFLDDSRFEYVPRLGRNLQRIKAEYRAEAILVWQKPVPVLHIGENRLFFHPSMAKVRLQAYRRKGQPDPLIEAARIEAGDRVLDCTLGLGADSIVLAYFARGPVVALESSPAIAYTIKWGMRLYHSPLYWLDEAIHRIQVEAVDHLSYLQALPDKSFDVVYFDPMFRKPLFKSETMNPIRVLGDPQPLSEQAIGEARRVAAKRVVMKERANSPEFSRLGFTRRAGSANNPVQFGIIEIERD